MMFVVSLFYMSTVNLLITPKYFGIKYILTVERGSHELSDRRPDTVLACTSWVYISTCHKAVFVEQRAAGNAVDKRKNYTSRFKSFVFGGVL
jgi:hypothetical protein